MIDFRYHLVSIASVFLALAVGIVLGAGPLKGTLGDTLAAEVAQLRTDADSLRGDLAEAESGLLARDEVLGTVRPRTTSGLLAGSSVSLLTLPGSPDVALQAARESLTEAGATISAEVGIDESWTSDDPPDVTERTAAAGELRELLAGDLPVGIAPERVLALALGWALGSDPTGGPAEDATSEPSTAPGDAATATPTETASREETVDDAVDGSVANSSAAGATSTRILQILAERGLIVTEEGLVPAQTDGVVLIAPTASDDATAVVAWSDLAGALDEAGAVLVAGDVPEVPEADTELVEAIRLGSDLSTRVSTVDNLTEPLGLLALPFAFAEQLLGQAGHYGTLDSAAGLFPPVPVEPAP